MSIVFDFHVPKRIRRDDLLSRDESEMLTDRCNHAWRANRPSRRVSLSCPEWNIEEEISID